MNIAADLKKRGLTGNFLRLESSLEEISQPLIFDVEVFRVAVCDVGNETGKTSIFCRFNEKMKVIGHPTMS